MPAIVSKEVFEKAMMKMSSNRSGKHRATEPYLLSGIIFCGKCGGALVGSSRGNPRTENTVKQRYYECNYKKRVKSCDLRAIKRDDIENAVIDYLENLMTKKTVDDMSGWLNENTKIYMKSIRSDLKSARSELATASRTVEKLLDKILDGLDSEAARVRLKEAEDKKFKLELRVTELESCSDNRVPISKASIKKYLSQLQGLRLKDRTEQAAIIKQFVSKVIVHEYDPENPDRQFTIKTNLDLAFAKMEDRQGHGSPPPLLSSKIPHWMEDTKRIIPS